MAIGQTITPREVAAVSSVETDAAVWETAIAAGTERTIAVYKVVLDTGFNRIGYAIAEESGGSWTWTEEGLVDPNSYAEQTLTDPSIAYDSVTGDFLVAALQYDQNGDDSIIVSRFDATTATFGEWEEINTSSSDDKPWIVAGEIGEIPAFGPFDPIEYQEFYITWQGPDVRLRYARSTDGGYNWNSSTNFDALTDPDDPNSVISGVITPAPRVAGAGPLYVVAAATGSASLIFVRGLDINSGPHAGEVSFKWMLDAEHPTELLELQPNISTSGFWYRVPNLGVANPSGPGFDMAADPSDPNKLCVVYHDGPDPNSLDMNIYMRTLRHDKGVKWYISAFDPNATVGDDDDPFEETDQFLPAIDVDPNDVIHVIYYDDRRYPQDDGFSVGGRFDGYYSVSSNGGADWIHRELCDDPNNDCQGTEPAVDPNDPTTGFFLGDYICIDVGPDRVWTAFMGICAPRDAYDDKSLIWSTQILR